MRVLPKPVDSHAGFDLVHLPEPVSHVKDSSTRVP